MERIGLLLGSFNPTHRAHVALGQWALGQVDRLWVVPSPGNPLKEQSSLAPWADRLAMVELAFRGIERVEVCTVEAELPAPHYTVQTIEYLQKTYPDKAFSIVCGGDIERELPRWHRWEELQKMVPFLVYPRGEGGAQEWADNSTAIRSGSDLEYLDPAVKSYIEDHNLYYAEALNEAKGAFAAQQFGSVLNLSLQHPENRPLAELAALVEEVLAFRHTDLYNP